MELINCHDCGLSVSFSAAACPNCGSRATFRLYRFSAREARRLGAEDRSDRTLILMTVGLGAVGAFYGAAKPVPAPLARWSLAWPMELLVQPP